MSYVQQVGSAFRFSVEVELGLVREPRDFQRNWKEGRVAAAHLGVDNIFDSHADSVQRSSLLDGDGIELARRLENELRIEESPRLDGRIALLYACDKRFDAVQVVLGQRPPCARRDRLSTH